MTGIELARRGRMARRMLPRLPKKNPTIKPRCRTHPPHRRTTVLRAIKGSYGIKSTICARLMITTEVFNRMLAYPGWERVAEAYREECDRLVDVAQDRLVRAMMQELDQSTALRAATYVLDRMSPQFKPKSTTQIEGGDKPIRIQQAVVNIPVEFLNAPPEQKRAILEAIEAGENIDRIQNG